jgi:hypothetical protein
MKFILGLVFGLALLASIPANAELYEDYVITIYNSTCIETANWQYCFVASSDEEIKETYEAPLLFKEVAQIGPNACIAEVYFP